MQPPPIFGISILKALQVCCFSGRPFAAIFHYSDIAISIAALKSLDFPVIFEFAISFDRNVGIMKMAGSHGG
jgi:hypothetical protein